MASMSFVLDDSVLDFGTGEVPLVVVDGVDVVTGAVSFRVEDGAPKMRVDEYPRVKDEVEKLGYEVKTIGYEVLDCEMLVDISVHAGQGQSRPQN
jgi:hypothetical protein